MKTTKKTSNEKFFPTAQKFVMDLISRREYSASELRQKLQDRDYSHADIESALHKAKENKWLARPEEMAGHLADQLHRKNKGIEFINSTLQEKGLPSVSRDEKLELEKALGIVNTKYGNHKSLSDQEKYKAKRLLAARGFESSLIQKVFHDEEF